jgi:hypothetical protein
MNDITDSSIIEEFKFSLKNDHSSTPNQNCQEGWHITIPRRQRILYIEATEPKLSWCCQ